LCHYRKRYIMSGIMNMFVGGGVGRVAYTLTISANTQNYDVYTNRSPSYVSGSSEITVQINPSVTEGSTSTPAYALLVPSSFSPTDTITIVNNGDIRGAGGNGGGGGPATNPGPVGSGSPGLSGGNAIYVNRPTTITNNGTVAGGGGGGGGGGGKTFDEPTPKTPRRSASGGGGGGGGAGASTVGLGGSGGTATAPNVAAPGSPGSSGSTTTGGAGGAGGAGAGGSQGFPGASGGGAGAAGSSATSGSGGAAGNYITGNSFVTWPAEGTRQGNVA